MVFSLLKAEMHTFCKTTSVHGVPRIVNSKSTSHSVIWLLGVLTCVCILIWQLTIIFKRYRSYPVNTVLLQSQEGDNVTFPDITVCNLYKLESKHISTTNDVYQALNKTVSAKAFKNFMSEHYPSVLYDVSSIFFAYFGASKI